MHNETEPIEPLEPDLLARRRFLIRAGVLALWLLGVALAIRSGWVPGFWWDASRPWPYPMGEVLTEIAKITLLSLGLYDLLRPQPEGSPIARTARGFGVLLITLVWSVMVTATDQPGYAYVTGGYVFILTALLLIALLVQLTLVAVRAIRRGRHAA